MSFSFRPLRRRAAWALLALPLAAAGAVPVVTAEPVCVRNCPAPATGAAPAPLTARPPGAPGESWGAIASTPRSYGYSYNHASRAEAERAARAQCDREGARAGDGHCEVHAFFNNACGALARGNYGEWAVAVEASDAQAGATALQQCNSHLPTEPCKVVASVCSPH